MTPRFYKSTTVATMVGGPKDFGGTKELEDLKAGRIQEALGSYLSDCKREGDKEGHFIRRSSNVKSYLVSKAVDSKLNRPPKLPVMVNDLK